MAISRRNFLQGAVAGAAALGLAGCAAKPNTTPEPTPDTTPEPEPVKVDQVLDCDIVIMGGGVSGLAGAVQAALDGHSVILLEKTDKLGSMGGAVEGQFGVESKMQKAAGIDFTIADVVAHEMEIAQFRSPGAQWIDLCTNSAGNIDWEIEQGVVFENVDDYFGTCTLATFHWFKDHKCSEGYIKPMGERAKQLGVDIRMNTAGYELIMDGKKVVGLYAKDGSGAVLQINAKAVILASGGVGGDPAMIKEQGWTSDDLMFAGNPASCGDAMKMTLAAGGVDILPEACAFIMNYIPALPSNNAPQYADALNGMVTGVACARGFGIWVNQDAKRFVNETIGYKNMMFQTMPTKPNKASYVVFTQAQFDAYYPTLEPKAKDILEASLKTNDKDSLYRADSIAELAGKVGLDAKELQATIDRYNDMCAAGKDTDFMRNDDTLSPIAEGPFLIARIEQTYFGSIGGILNSAKHEALTADMDPIPGLYIAGLDGAMLYRNVYTINLGGSCCANNVNSGRYSAIAAHDYIASL